MAYDKDLAFFFYCPTKIIYGENSVNEVAVEVGELGCSKVFLVTDPGIVEVGLAGRVEKVLGNKLVGTFSGCCQDTGHHIINEAAGIAKDSGADCLVSVGGGSVMDTAKAVSILLKSGGQIQDYTGFQMLSEKQTPHVAIPTTAGTGSEVTSLAVIKDWERNQKQLLGSDYIIPDIAVLDPTMTAGLPPILTATTGMDAMSHAVESISTWMCNPITDAAALHAVRLIMENLPKCVEEGGDLVARGQQLLASNLAGMAFGGPRVGLAHAIAHTMGGLYEVPHGMGNSIILPHVMMFNLDECPDRYAMIAHVMGLDTRGMSDMEAGEAAANALWDLTKKMGVPQKLGEVGVPEDGLESIAEMTMSDAAIVNNPKTVVDPDEVLGVLKKAF